MKSEYNVLRNKFLEHYEIPPFSVLSGPITVIVCDWMRVLCNEHGWMLHEFLDIFEKDCI